MYINPRYVDQLGSVDDIDPAAAPPLMCLVEELRGGMGADERVCVSMITISPSTGDVVWDQFEGRYCMLSPIIFTEFVLECIDNHMRTELEVGPLASIGVPQHLILSMRQTRMVHTSPCEILLPEGKLSQSTEKLLAYFTA